jgi:predicted nucleic acid-binding protein
MKIIIDSSVFIDFTRDSSGNLDELLNLFRQGKTFLLVPTVVISELWAGESMENKKEELLVTKMLDKLTKIDLNEQIAKTAGKLMRRSQVSNAFDSVIAATALECEAQLATRNIKHFAGVKGLKIFGLQKS